MNTITDNKQCASSHETLIDKIESQERQLSNYIYILDIKKTNASSCLLKFEEKWLHQIAISWLQRVLVVPAWHPCLWTDNTRLARGGPGNHDASVPRTRETNICEHFTLKRAGLMSSQCDIRGFQTETNALNGIASCRSMAVSRIH